MNETYTVRQLLGRVRERPYALSVAYGPGTLIVRSPDGERLLGLALNQHGALCWHRAVDDRTARTLVRRGVEAGESVTIDRVESVVPSRREEIPAALRGDQA